MAGANGIAPEHEGHHLGAGVGVGQSGVVARSLPVARADVGAQSLSDEAASAVGGNEVARVGDVFDIQRNAPIGVLPRTNNALALLFRKV